MQKFDRSMSGDPRFTTHIVQDLDQTITENGQEIIELLESDNEMDNGMTDQSRHASRVTVQFPVSVVLVVM